MSVRHEPVSCPTCRHELDAAESLREDDPSTPGPRSFTLCMYCGELLRWDPAMRLRRASKADGRDLGEEQWAAIRQAQGFIRQRRKSS